MSRRAVVALGLAGLLAWAGAAEAGCAWVLWENEMIGSSTPAGAPVTITLSAWSPRQGFEHASACLAAIASLPARMHERYVFRCLPDTVDPRAPTAR